MVNQSGPLPVQVAPMVSLASPAGTILLTMPHGPRRWAIALGTPEGHDDAIGVVLGRGEIDIDHRAIPTAGRLLVGKAKDHIGRGIPAAGIESIERGKIVDPGIPRGKPGHGDRCSRAQGGRERLQCLVVRKRNILAPPVLFGDRIECDDLGGLVVAKGHLTTSR